MCFVSRHRRAAQLNSLSVELPNCFAYSNVDWFVVHLVRNRRGQPGSSAVTRLVSGVDTAVVLSSMVLDVLPHLLDRHVQVVVGLLLLLRCEVVGIVSRLVGYAARLFRWCVGGR